MRAAGRGNPRMGAGSSCLSARIRQCPPGTITRNRPSQRTSPVLPPPSMVGMPRFSRITVTISPPRHRQRPRVDLMTSRASSCTASAPRRPVRGGYSSPPTVMATRASTRRRTRSGSARHLQRSRVATPKASSRRTRGRQEATALSSAVRSAPALVSGASMPSCRKRTRANRRSRFIGSSNQSWPRASSIALRRSGAMASRGLTILRPGRSTQADMPARPKRPLPAPRRRAMVSAWSRRWCPVRRCSTPRRRQASSRSLYRAFLALSSIPPRGFGPVHGSISESMPQAAQFLVTWCASAAASPLSP